jgi:hypothetical protein
MGSSCEREDYRRGVRAVSGRWGIARSATAPTMNRVPSARACRTWRAEFTCLRPGERVSWKATVRGSRRMVRRPPRQGGEQVAVAETGVCHSIATHPCLMGVDASPAPPRTIGSAYFRARSVVESAFSDGPCFCRRSASVTRAAHMDIRNPPHQTGFPASLGHPSRSTTWPHRAACSPGCESRSARSAPPP